MITEPSRRETIEDSVNPIRAARSLATAQRSLGPGNPVHDLFPTLLAGCPDTSNDTMQYPLEVAYDYASARHLSFRRGACWRDWEEILPPVHVRASMPVGGTPLVNVSEVAPRQHQGRGVYIKDESRNPTWSHKDRLNKLTISAALHEGASTIIVASSGNHGVSAAAMASRGGLNCIVLTMPDVSAAFRAMIRSYGAYPVFLPSEARWSAMRALQSLPGTYPVSNLTPIHTGHPWGPEGYKTIAYEILAEMDGRVPAAVVVPTGYGELLYGIYKGFSEARLLGHINRIPQLVSVEPAARGPLHHAIKRGDPANAVVARPTVQSGTATIVTGYRAIRAIQDSNGIALLVEDEAARAANRMLGRQGLWQEISSSAAFAALGDLTGLNNDGPIVVIGCSTGLKEHGSVDRVKMAEPDIASLRLYLKREFNFEL
ncbi:pyridoxal-phosphate dependent enzyme [Mesorhizobium sp. STM 4661]|uniref:threonine synthase n=1 Tax=Mesorhizobium sp. STM 4661 TaxID=1297570 RepID=UPI0002BDD325|nr:pyridoxal-phosphate dependent enzyme [Mesorhizobium sp. STM 4661]CCV13721.1 Putative threonine synthase (modular protein) [Mesorhizobium sp. STM 4661]